MIYWLNGKINQSISENVTKYKILKAVSSFALVDAVFLHQTKRRIFCLEWEIGWSQPSILAIVLNETEIR